MKKLFSLCALLTFPLTASANCNLDLLKKIANQEAVLHVIRAKSVSHYIVPLTLEGIDLLALAGLSKKISTNGAEIQKLEAETAARLPALKREEEYFRRQKARDAERSANINIDRLLYSDYFYSYAEKNNTWLRDLELNSEEKGKVKNFREAFAEFREAIGYKMANRIGYADDNVWGHDEFSEPRSLSYRVRALMAGRMTLDDLRRMDEKLHPDLPKGRIYFDPRKEQPEWPVRDVTEQLEKIVEHETFKYFQSKYVKIPVEPPPVRLKQFEREQERIEELKKSNRMLRRIRMAGLAGATLPIAWILVEKLRAQKKPQIELTESELEAFAHELRRLKEQCSQP